MSHKDVLSDIQQGTQQEQKGTVKCRNTFTVPFCIYGSMRLTYCIQSKSRHMLRFRIQVF